MSGRQVFQTRDGTRYVETIMSDGHLAFRVTDPRHIFQDQWSHGVVRIITRELEDGTTVLSQTTITGLALLNVDIAELVPAEPIVAPGRVTHHPAIARRPGETVSELNQRKYTTLMETLVSDIEARKGTGEQVAS